jgi:hypothetical protein
MFIENKTIVLNKTNIRIIIIAAGLTDIEIPEPTEINTTPK